MRRHHRVRLERLELLVRRFENLARGGFPSPLLVPREALDVRPFPVQESLLAGRLGRAGSQRRRVHRQRALHSTFAERVAVRSQRRGCGHGGGAVGGGQGAEVNQARPATAARMQSVKHNTRRLQRETVTAAATAVDANHRPAQAGKQAGDAPE